MNERDIELARPWKWIGAEGWTFRSEVDLQEFAALTRADEREACARDADWCVQNHLEHLIPERIRARGNK